MNNPADSKRYWFKRRRYGYGWTPVTWQGWMVLIAFLIVLIVSAIILAGSPDSNESIELYLSVVAVSVIALVLVTLRTGPSPKWRWGRKSDDSDTEDF